MANPQPILSRRTVIFAEIEQNNDSVSSYAGGPPGVVTLNTGGLSTDAEIGKEVIIYDGSEDDHTAVHRTVITDNAASTITLLERPDGVFTPQATDEVKILNYAKSSIDPSSTAARAILCTMPELTFNGEMLARDYTTKSLTKLEGVMGNKSVNIAFSCEIKGNGGGGASLPTLNKLDPLLRACGFSRTDTTASTSYREYTPADEAQESVCIDVFADGLKYVIRGCVGNATFKFEQGKISMIDFEFTGLYADPTSEAIPSYTYDSTLPKILTYASLQGFGSTDVPASTLEMNMNNEIIDYYNMSKQAAGDAERYMIANRAPSGSFNPQGVIVEDTNWFNKFSTSGTSGTFSLRVGGNTSTGAVVSGQSVDFTFGAKSQAGTIGLTDDGGIRRFEVGFNVAAALTAPNTDLSIKFY